MVTKRLPPRHSTSSHMDTKAVESGPRAMSAPMKTRAEAADADDASLATAGTKGKSARSERRVKVTSAPVAQ